MMRFEMTKPLFSATAASYLVLLLVFALFVFLAIMFMSAGKYQLIIDSGRIDIKSVFYNTSLPMENIDIENVKVINLDEAPVRSIRINGIGLQGLQIGWFTRNGKKSKMYITDTKSVVLIPTKKNYDILFSSNEAAAIVDRIKNR
jgi:hypothetical protein